MIKAQINHDLGSDDSFDNSDKLNNNITKKNKIDNDSIIIHPVLYLRISLSVSDWSKYFRLDA